MFLHRGGKYNSEFILHHLELGYQSNNPLNFILDQGTMGKTVEFYRISRIVFNETKIKSTIFYYSTCFKIIQFNLTKQYQ
ncbi:hypothetical protein EFB08_14315 [Rufibacter latericius]|uniref:Uncharacterized protein n=1 Tax=Rufibacter latericius TaxID=2487040 RepID=A0A3M9MM97_9BACT|nr:hypothetical protein EFB08_14315 [Rufibacter latericius]